MQQPVLINKQDLLLVDTQPPFSATSHDMQYAIDNFVVTDITDMTTKK